MSTLSRQLAQEARHRGPVVPGHFRVVVLESGGKASVSDHSDLGSARRHADDAAAESDDAPPLAMVFDAEFQMVHQGGHHAAPAPAPAATLEDAIELAVRAHRGQVDKAGQPYILHPLRVMMRVDSVPARMAAVLHDLLEDTPATAQDLRKCGFSEEVVAAIECLTRRPDEAYEAFVDRVAGNPLAAAVKRADLADNLDVTRLEAVTWKDAERMNRYLAALRRLSEP